MSAISALHAAYVAGVEIAIHGQNLVLDAASAPPSVVVDGLRGNKGEICALLSDAETIWRAGEWVDFFEERAAIAEFEGGLSRHDAEQSALTCCRRRWLAPDGSQVPRSSSFLGDGCDDFVRTAHRTDTID